MLLKLNLSQHKTVELSPAIKPTAIRDSKLFAIIQCQECKISREDFN